MDGFPRNVAVVERSARMGRLRSRAPYIRTDGESNDEMPQSNLYEAQKHCDAMRELIVQHTGGWADAASLEKFQQMAQSAAAAVEDPECKHTASLVIELAT